MKINFIKDRLEIECAPLTWCNLKCSFCENNGNWLDHDPEVLKRTLDIIKTQGSNFKKIDIGFWGGEVLADALDQSIIDQYDQFLEDVHQLCTQIGVPVTVDVCSNLIHHRVNWLIKWKKQYNIVISTSFDLAERFNKPKQLQLFKQNVETIFAQGYNININMVAIRPNVDALYQNDPNNQLLQYMNYLYERGANFEIEYYNDVCGVPELLLTPKQLAEFMVYMFDRYPKFANFRHTLPIWQKRAPEETSSVFVAVYPKALDVYRYPIDQYDSNKLASKLIKQKHCFMCQYFGKCAPRHPIEYEDGDFCITKYIMENITIDPNKEGDDMHCDLTQRFKDKEN